MKLDFKTSFRRDLRRIRDTDTQNRLRVVIGELEAASSISEIRGIVRIRAVGRHYRIRVGEYRMGISVDGNVLILARFLHRSDIYRFFP